MFIVAKSPNVAIDTRIARIFKDKCTDFKMFLISTFNWRFHAGDKKKKKKKTTNGTSLEADAQTLPHIQVASHWWEYLPLDAGPRSCCFTVVVVTPWSLSVSDIYHKAHGPRASGLLHPGSYVWALLLLQEFPWQLPPHTHIQLTWGLFPQVSFLWTQASLIVPGDAMPFFYLLFLFCLNLSLLEFPGASLVAQW